MRKNRFCKALLLLVMSLAVLTTACQNKSDRCAECWDECQIYEYYLPSVGTYTVETICCMAIVYLSSETENPSEIERLLKGSKAELLRFSRSGKFAIFDGFGRAEYSLIIGSDDVRYIHPYLDLGNGNDRDNICRPDQMSHSIICRFVSGITRTTVDSFALANDFHIYFDSFEHYSMWINCKYTHPLRVVLELQQNQLIEWVEPSYLAFPID